MLKSDSQGFLIGEPVHDIRKAVDQLRTIRNDVSAIKNALLDVPNSDSNGSKNTAIDHSAKIATPSSPRSHDNAPSNTVALPVRPKGRSSVPGSISAAKGTAKLNVAAIPTGRDALGRFTGKSAIETGRNKSKSKGTLSHFSNRIATTAIGATAGAEEADPAIKAF
jgi:hypothetical protein